MRTENLPATHEAIAALIPHQGAMCLIDAVSECSPTGIVCRTRSHAREDNPLLREGRLAALHLCEYGAQAMALHGSLTGDAPGASHPGWLVALRDVVLAMATVDPDGTLEVRAQQLHSGSSGLQYEFAVACGDRLLASGRATVMFRRTT